MPIVRIDLSKNLSAQVIQTISETVYEAMTNVANVPHNDKFQVITRHESDELVFPSAGYLGISYTASIVFIQITWNAGRSTEIKKAFYSTVADGISKNTPIRKEDVFINLVDVVKENWSFGNGEMQYAPAE